MNSEVDWVLVSSGTHVPLQIILDPGYFPNYFFVSYDYASTKRKFEMIAEIIKDFDIFLTSESKLDSTFPNAQR